MQVEETQQPSKESQVFERNLKTLAAIVGGEEKLIPASKVPADKLGELVEGLLKEEKEATEKEIIGKLRALLNSYVTLQKELKAKEQELEKLKNQKLKEFNEASKALFARVDGLRAKEEEYYTALGAAVQGKEDGEEAGDQ